MRTLVVFFCAILLVNCQKEVKKPSKPTFLIGNWIRLNDSEGNKTYENWKSDLTGMGITINNGKTVFNEQMSILEINDTLHLKVSNVNETPTYFKFTSQTDTSFVCENPQNEFPKKIHYFIENQQLKAIISSDDFRIDFIFEKVK
ncbi:hypothetical protein IU405_03300 [Polaribacter sp. BAL334]|jgi:hypothetical protein|uniref:DUF6265 family protein n=1 Tax=Polaribacter sp. BAL334 TaxID=1708178 RepID=UPI0018D2181F|nr:DUF6265 family protein [Polaribacter sp. BAL334]MBG7611266.1 hypothetical protein [Polaribacter sp. BAL334]